VCSKLEDYRTNAPNLDRTGPYPEEAIGHKRKGGNVVKMSVGDQHLFNRGQPVTRGKEGRRARG
jgi:hypothetical protein